MDILQVLRPLEQLERRLSDLYQWFGELFEGDGEAAFVFHRMYLEETSHVRLIEYQRRLARGNPAAFAGVDVRLDGLQETIARVDAMRGSPAPPTLEQAVRMALELESGAAKYHLKHAIQQASPDMARLLGSLGAGDKQHVKSLRELAARRGWS